MERTYTILLDKGGRYPARQYRADPKFEQPLQLASGLMANPPRPAIHRERLTAQELQEFAQEPEFVAAAEVMRTRLLSPVAECETANGAVVRASGQRRKSWSIAAVGADRSKFTGADVSVAVLDTGIDAGHPAFRDVDLVRRDFTGLGHGDSDGHGTHCAGILFGRNVDGMRIGVAPGVRKALIGKVLGPQGGDSDMLIRGLVWAHDQAAHVISLSVGLDFPATVAMRLEQGWASELATTVALEAYCDNIKLLNHLLRMLRMQEPFTGGAVVVAAAGNDSRRRIGDEHIVSACPPCGSDGIVSVGSLDPDTHGTGHRVSDFSNTGVEITAPGRGIVSAAAGGGLQTLSGTSVAAPHVAGVAALWWQAVRQSGLPANATLVRGKLIGSAQARGFSPASYPADRGAGCALAPRDSVALTQPRAADRAPLDDNVWPDRELNRSLAADFDPISLDLGFRRSEHFGGRRNLC